ncbi:glucose 1-dehydrogenase [Novosphingobium sp. KCTC 2891]|uniref:glucose 1-dehydrogenase n=1 Tax=Novosphingobium sp. KCTC 2891 TaxID=2989730 RepID=UPI002223BFBB|nr:glucose 1-dehydrogenase [Novosphingobium sp. KCTC 2891]
MQAKFDLSGQVAIVTGAAQGMGESFAVQLAAAGARVVVADINDALGTAVAERIGEGAMFVHHDVTSRAEWDAVIAAAEERWGPVSILVNNAGIAVWGSMETVDEAEARKMLDVDLMGVLIGMQAVIPTMRRAGHGSIVNIASVASMKGTEGLTVYSAAKWAVRGMTKCAALELGADNIRVNAVHPGMIATAMTVDMPDPQGQPIKRKGGPDEVGNTVLFLASDASSYTTGCDFVVDGGMTIGV